MLVIISVTIIKLLLYYININNESPNSKKDILYNNLTYFGGIYMKKIRKGDIVSRNSYQNDILFYVKQIVKLSNRGEIAILKGITIRIEADAPINDLEIPQEKRIKESFEKLREKIEISNVIDNREFVKNGKILHLDGDRNYSEKTEKYYKKQGLNYIVKHVTEFRQPAVIRNLLQRYKPDIVVITRT